MLHYLRVGLLITITQSHTHAVQQTHTHKAVTQRVEANKLLSRRRQLEYSGFEGGSGGDSRVPPPNPEIRFIPEDSHACITYLLES